MMENNSKKVYEVSEITFFIKSLLEKNFNTVCVKGEISNFKKQASGHLYFSLKDKNAQISAAFFKRSAQKLTRLPKDGDQVIAIGEISVYPPHGNYQLIVKELNFLGLGELLIQLQRLKEKLKGKGYFDPSNKIPIPKLPKTIGVVTSPTGAVIQDILNVLTRRYFNFRLILNPVRVQGKEAAGEIAQAINEFNKHNLADVLIVGRGGGSLEDLWCFNEEIVADAIFNSKIPIIAAIGHETDHTIADYVADKRAPTPSAAAEIVMSEKKQLLENLLTYQKQTTKILQSTLKNAKEKLSYILKQPIFSSSDAILFKHVRKTDEYRNLFDITVKNILENKKSLYNSYLKQLKAITPQTRITLLKQKLNSLTSGIDTAISTKLSILNRQINQKDLSKQAIYSINAVIKNKKTDLMKLMSHLKSLDPKNILKKGYSIIFSKKDDCVILSSKDLQKNQKIYAVLHDGTINATVD